MTTKDNQLQLQEDKKEGNLNKQLPNNNIQIHPEFGVIDVTERTWHDMWPKNDKQQDVDEENADVVICKKDTQEKTAEEKAEVEVERSWNDMWP